MADGRFGRDLTQGSIASQLLGFVGPLFVSNVLQTVYNLVDMAVVGRCVGRAGLSAVSVCGELMNVLVFTAMGFSNAGQVLISQHTGAGRTDEVRRLIGTLLSLLLCVSLLLTVVSLIFRESILHFVNVPEQAIADARVYLTVSAAGLAFTYGYNAISAILRGMGDSCHPFVFVALASVLNIVLDLVLVPALGLGVFGAAFATVFSQGVSFIASVVFLSKNRSRFVFDFRLSSFRFHGDSLLSLVRLGVPMALQSAFIQGSKLIVTRWINDSGVSVSAITGVGNKFNSIGLTFSSAVGTSGAAIIGQCIGARKYERVGKTILVSGAMSVCIAAVLSGAVLLFPRGLFSLFTDDAEILNKLAMQPYQDDAGQSFRY